MFAVVVGTDRDGNETRMALGDLRTLILDDNAHMRGLVRAILLSFKINRVLEAADAQTGLEIIRENEIDLAFVDYRLGGQDGLMFCREIRTGEESPDPFLPIIMITAYSELSRVKQAINAGIDEFLVKPVRANDVASRINAVVQRRRPFVRSDDYFGPDRRRRKDPNYKGPMRRAEDPGEVDIL